LMLAAVILYLSILLPTAPGLTSSVIGLICFAYPLLTFFVDVDYQLALGIYGALVGDDDESIIEPKMCTAKSCCGCLFAATVKILSAPCVLVRQAWAAATRPTNRERAQAPNDPFDSEP
jgi:hypothetical protein